ncbi:MAG: hypothetical protein PHY15_02010 [Eubacteriales bacterium]|nr:hypothetical protein [Eubacteriales bacterium]MDD4475623.1 hypothetical protein [Eubacteriales bacterium]
MTVKKLFEMALDLLGERRKDGSFSDNSVYLSSRTLTAVNQVLAELSSAQARLSGESFIFLPVTADNDEIVLDDRLLYAAAPSGIASVLMLGEDDDRYASYRLLFEKALAGALRSAKAVNLEIRDIYS